MLARMGSKGDLSHLRAWYATLRVLIPHRQHFASFSCWSPCYCIVLSGRNMAGPVQMKQRKQNLDLVRIVKGQIYLYSKLFLPPCSRIANSTKWYTLTKPNTANTITKIPALKGPELFSISGVKTFNLEGSGWFPVAMSQGINCTAPTHSISAYL